MKYSRTQHKYKDADLITGAAFAKQAGVSDAAISKAKKSGRVDTFENSEGVEMFHKSFSLVQYQRSRDRRHVTTATRAQRALGMDNAAAQAVAHDSAFDNPSELYARAGIKMIPDETADLGEVFEQRQTLEISKAELVQYQARIAKNKANEQEGRLVDKNLCYQRAYQIGAEIQDKIVNIYAKLGPKILGRISEALVSMVTVAEDGSEAPAPLNAENIQSALKTMEHEIGEMIRCECLDAIRELAEKTVETILD